nr:aminopeptidase N [Gammaproteobacteria bacterium]
MKERINSTQTRTTYLKDYQVPDYLVDSTQLTFELQPQKTLVHSRLQVHRNPAVNSEKLPALFLNGVDLELLSIVVDGKELSSAEFDRFSDGVAIPVTKHKFIVEIRNTINPQNNTSLEGLYLSNN